MNKQQQNIIDKYYKETKCEISTFYPNRKSILNQIYSSLSQFAIEHIDFTYEDLIENFGKPSDFADSLIDLDSSSNMNHRYFDRRKVLLLSVSLTIFIMIFICFIAIIVMKENGERVTEIIITTEEEYVPTISDSSSVSGDFTD